MSIRLDRHIRRGYNPSRGRVGHRRRIRRPPSVDLDRRATGVLQARSQTIRRGRYANLFDNVWKFTGTRLSAHIELGRNEVEGHPVFFVRDNGVDYDTAYAHKLFGVFQRLQKSSEYPGTGVNLATVQRIVRRHGGRVWAEAGVDQGALFRDRGGSMNPKIILLVLRRIRADERTRRLPVVVLTSSREERDLASSYDLGVNSYIRKPVDFAQFAEAVRQLSLYWPVLDKLPSKARP
ncbi:MAG: hypothetical protein JXO72_04780 [Vicinamibacteria bacterium]|nr:hypothetical protein [Vicinamibacteria bacterium]